jgi:hypothetical protein
MKTYKTFKQLIAQLSEIRNKEDLWQFCAEVDMSYQHDKITANDNETIYKIINHVVKREYIG